MQVYIDHESICCEMHMDRLGTVSSSGYWCAFPISDLLAALMYFANEDGKPSTLHDTHQRHTSSTGCCVRIYIVGSIAYSNTKLSTERDGQVQRCPSRAVNFQHCAPSWIPGLREPDPLQLLEPTRSVIRPGDLVPSVGKLSSAHSSTFQRSTSTYNS